MSSTGMVVKLGGSLLQRPNFVQRVQHWAEQLDSAAAILLITGGGVLADAVRTAYAQGELNCEQAHWAAIAAMDQNAKTIASLLGWPLVDAPDQTRKRAVLRCESFLREQEPKLTGVKLPLGWQTTSDSIAARIAEICDRKLVLLKSTEPPDAAQDFTQLAIAGYVDQHFPHASRNLRNVEFQTL